MHLSIIATFPRGYCTLECPCDVPIYLPILYVPIYVPQPPTRYTILPQPPRAFPTPPAMASTSTATSPTASTQIPWTPLATRRSRLKPSWPSLTTTPSLPLPTCMKGPWLQTIRGTRPRAVSPRTARRRTIRRFGTLHTCTRIRTRPCISGRR